MNKVLESQTELRRLLRIVVHELTTQRLGRGPAGNFGYNVQEGASFERGQGSSTQGFDDVVRLQGLVNETYPHGFEMMRCGWPGQHYSNWNSWCG